MLQMYILYIYKINVYIICLNVYEKTYVYIYKCIHLNMSTLVRIYIIWMYQFILYALIRLEREKCIFGLDYKFGL